jgi:hypothetical protein
MMNLPEKPPKALALLSSGRVPLAVTLPDGSKIVSESLQPVEAGQITAWRMEPGKATGRRVTRGGD